MMAVSKLIKYLILIAVFVLLVWFFYSETGVFGKVTNKTEEGLARYLPNITLGADKLKGEKVVLPEKQRKEIEELKKALETVLNSEKGNCFLKFGGFSDFGEEGASIEMNYNSREDETNIVVLYGKPKKEARVTEEGFSLKGMRPCVIAGNNIVNNFDKTFLNREEGALSTYFSSVSRIRIDFNLDGLNENRISYGYDEADLNDFKDFEGHQWLFTPHSAKGRKEICFFPTADGLKNCAARGDLLDDDCFDNSDEEGISYQLRGKDATSCATMGLPAEETNKIKETITPPSMIEGGRPLPGGVPEE